MAVAHTTTVATRVVQFTGAYLHAVRWLPSEGHLVRMDGVMHRIVALDHDLPHDIWSVAFEGKPGCIEKPDFQLFTDGSLPPFGPPAVRKAAKLV